MTWTYDGDPSGNPKDEVRFMVGDTDQATPMVNDEEITYFLTTTPATGTNPPWLAAAQVCDSIAAKFGRKVQQTLGPLSASNQQQYEHYVALAQQYRTLYATNGRGVTTTLGGVVRAAPVLGGGGRTYLGASTYSNPDGSGR